MKFASIDSVISLLLAFCINAAILIVSAAAFHYNGHNDVADIYDAHKLLVPVLGTSLAGGVFALALLASGQNSTITGTMAGQIVMEGFIHWKIKPWIRRLITRSIAIVPAFTITLFFGEKGVSSLLILSQVVLSMQLSFAVFPLVEFTSSKLKMGTFANRLFTKYMAWIVAIFIASINLFLLYLEFFKK